MWPFKRKDSSQEFGPEHYNVTSDEQEAIANAFQNFVSPDGRRIGLEAHPPEVTRGLVAYGLWMFAEQKMDGAEFVHHTPNRVEIETLIGEAVQAIRKAHAIHRLPIYLYDMARCLHKKGNLSVARNAYQDFLMAQSQFRPLTYDGMFLRHRDIDEAIRDANEQIAQIERGATQGPEPPRDLPPERPPIQRHPRAW